MNPDEWRLAKAFTAAGAVLLFAVLGIFLLLELRFVLAVLFLGVIVGVSLNPVVERLDVVHVPRVAGVILVYAALAALFAVFLYYAALQVSQTTFDIKLEEIKADYDRLAADSGLPASAEVEQSARDFAGGAVGGILNQALSVASAAFSVITILFTGLLFTITQERMRGVLLLFVRPHQRARVEDLLHKLASGLRRFVLAELVAMTTVGSITFIGLVVIGVEFPLMLAFIAFFAEAVPMIGPAIAFVPAFAVALTDGFWPAVQVCILFLAIQGIENYLITPVIHGRGSEIPAMLIFVALLVGGALMGIVGALVALPAAVCVHILFFEVVVPWTRERVGDPPAELKE